MEAERRKLPIGIQTFREIREEGCYYADKTDHIDVLLLCRRREFGAWWFETGTPTFLVDMLTQREHTQCFRCY